nr:tetratricopeptide repeat protein [uncultured Allomuricauda sp.]
MNDVERRKNAEEIFKSGAHLFQGSPESMISIEKAIEIDPTYAEAIRELSVAYLKRGMPHKWKPIMDKAVYHDPKTWVPWRGYLYLYFYRDYKKAIIDFNASDTLTPSMDYPQGHSVDFWRGIAYLGLKNYNKSIVYLDKHIKKETEDTGEDWVEIEAFLYRGIAHYESGNNKKAIENFHKILHYFQFSADAKYYLAKILTEEGKSAEALVLINKAIDDYQKGYYNNYHYVELLRQIYPEDLEELKSQIIL